MENEQTPKPKFRWGRLILMILLACLFMVIGYVGGNMLKEKLAKKLMELEEAEEKAKQAAAVEDVDYEESDDEESEKSETIGEQLKEGLKEKIVEPISKKLNGKKLLASKKKTN